MCELCNNYYQLFYTFSNSSNKVLIMDYNDYTKLIQKIFHDLKEPKPIGIGKNAYIYKNNKLYITVPLCWEYGDAI